MIIASIHAGYSAQAILVLDTLRHVLEKDENSSLNPDDQIEVRNFIEVQALLAGEKVVWEELYGLNSQRDKLDCKSSEVAVKPPDVCLIWLPTDDCPPDWASALHKKLQSALGSTILVWIYWDLKDNRKYQRAFNLPAQESFLLNLDNPGGWSVTYGNKVDWESFISFHLKRGPDSTYTALFAWLHNLMTLVRKGLDKRRL